MKTEYIEFNLILGNGDIVQSVYCDQWGSPMFGNRTIHFEFLGCLSISLYLTFPFYDLSLYSCDIPFSTP